MPTATTSRIRIGITGWNTEVWRGGFYPEGLVQRRELEYASRQVKTIEINETSYGIQKPETFAQWHDEVPEDFVFTLKAPRFATARPVLSEAGETVERFCSGGILDLKDKLGPINWQFMSTRVFDPIDFEGFLKLLPASVEGRTLRHAVEVRHESFRVPAFVALARKYGVAVVIAGDSEYPLIPDVTAPFVYARIMGTRAEEPLGYPAPRMDVWLDRARDWAAGEPARGLAPVTPAAAETVPRDVFLYVVRGDDARNPAAAVGMIARMEAQLSGKVVA